MFCQNPTTTPTDHRNPDRTAQAQSQMPLTGTKRTYSESKPISKQVSPWAYLLEHVLLSIMTPSLFLDLESFRNANAVCMQWHTILSPLFAKLPFIPTPFIERLFYCPADFSGIVSRCVESAYGDSEDYLKINCQKDDLGFQEATEIYANTDYRDYNLQNVDSDINDLDVFVTRHAKLIHKKVWNIISRRASLVSTLQLAVFHLHAEDDEDDFKETLVEEFCPNELMDAVVVYLMSGKRPDDSPELAEALLCLDSRNYLDPDEISVLTTRRSILWDDEDYVNYVPSYQHFSTVVVTSTVAPLPALRENELEIEYPTPLGQAVLFIAHLLLAELVRESKK